MNTTLTTRTGYLNTGSSAGTPRTYSFNPDDVTCVLKWSNVYGNPSYCILFARGTVILDETDAPRGVLADSLYLVDNFQGLSEFHHVPVRSVARRKDLFASCRWA